MRISEKMGLVYTALFLTVSIAIITQNSDKIMAAFRGETSARAVDDIFTVQAGRTQRLFVLGNDLHPEQIKPTDVRLLGQPECGKVRQLGGGFEYSGSASCSGYQTFAYCVNTGKHCIPANVTLRVIKARDPIASIGDNSISDLSGFKKQLSLNSRDLEISNVRLGKTAPTEKSPRKGPISKMASVAVETVPEFSRPGHLPGQLAVGQASQPPASATRLSDTTATQPTDTDARITRREAAADPTNMNDSTRQARIKGPASNGNGLSCTPTVSARPTAEASVELTIRDACLAGETVTIQHGKLRFADRLDASGTLLVTVPALEKVAHFRITLPKAKPLRVTARVPDIESYERVAVLWRGRFDVDLRAVEFGKSIATLSHAGTGALGHLVKLGNTDVKNPLLAEVYTIRLRPGIKSGVVDFSILVRATRQTCGTGQILQSLRSRRGLLIGASGLRFRLPDCDAADTTLVLKNAVRDLIIAAR
ncbi:MAG: hypothetical protein Q9M41_09415 [Paracoccaceae bacterium]|nr:hypothetical protein [Paracoccaceae bacterium]